MNTHNGMELLDQALVRLYRSGIINHERVLDFCNDREEIAKLTGEREALQPNGQDVVLTTQFN
jgi:Tfp pilus assembly ATPase PilU